MAIEQPMALMHDAAWSGPESGGVASASLTEANTDSQMMHGESVADSVLFAAHVVATSPNCCFAHYNAPSYVRRRQICFLREMQYQGKCLRSFRPGIRKQRSRLTEGLLVICMKAITSLWHACIDVRSEVRKNAGHNEGNLGCLFSSSHAFILYRQS